MQTYGTQAIGTRQIHLLYGPPITRDNGRLSVTVPQFSCYCAIAFEVE